MVIDELTKKAYESALRDVAYTLGIVKERRKMMINRAYKAGLNQREIAEALGISKQQVGKIIKESRQYA